MVGWLAAWLLFFFGSLASINSLGVFCLPGLVEIGFGRRGCGLGFARPAFGEAFDKEAGLVAQSRFDEEAQGFAPESADKKSGDGGGPHGAELLGDLWSKFDAVIMQHAIELGQEIEQVQAGAEHAGEEGEHAAHVGGVVKAAEKARFKEAGFVGRMSGAAAAGEKEKRGGGGHEEREQEKYRPDRAEGGGGEVGVHGG